MFFFQNQTMTFHVNSLASFVKLSKCAIFCYLTPTIFCVPSLFEETGPDPVKLPALIMSFRTCGSRVRVCMKTGGGVMPHNRLRSVTMEINNSCWRK